MHSLLCSAYAGRNPEGFPSHSSWGSVYKIYSKTVYSASFRMVIVFSAKSFASTIIRRKPFGVPPYMLMCLHRRQAQGAQLIVFSLRRAEP